MLPSLSLTFGEHLYINIKIHPYERNMTLSSKRRRLKPFQIDHIHHDLSHPYYIPELFSPVNVLPHGIMSRRWGQGSEIPAAKPTPEPWSWRCSSHTTCHSLPISSHDNFSSMWCRVTGLMLKLFGTIYPSVHSFVLILGKWQAKKSHFWCCGSWGVAES